MQPFEWREQVEARVNGTKGAERDPDIVWKMMTELGQRQAIPRRVKIRFCSRVRNREMMACSKKNARSHSGDSYGKVMHKESGASSRTKSAFSRNGF